VTDVPRMILLSGFLGAGKTTLLQEAARALAAQGHRPVVITNDQGEELVDTSLARGSGLAVGEVTAGCFCCRFDDLVEVATGLAQAHGADVVLAEAVGSCTDIAATVVRPLRATGAMTVAPLTTVVGTDRLRHMLGLTDQPVDDNVRYLFEKQVEEAEVVALNKTDLCTADEVEELRWAIGQRWPHARLTETVARDGHGLDALVADWLAGDTVVAAPERAVEVDYDRYADAEAQMGWLNARVTIAAAAGEPFSARNWILAFGHGLRAELADGTLVGHLKLHLEAEGAATKASLVGFGRPIEFDRDELAPTTACTGLVNARIGTTPEALDAAVRVALAAADRASGTVSSVDRLDCFSPSRPVPTHRIPAGA
jgi:Ni2+-binding GTPase involved in maturation of urease and hydrogenase